MERIQSAIEKARQARHQGTEPKTRAPIATREAEKPLLPEREERWKNIRSFHPDLAKLRSSRIMAYQSCPEAAPYDVMRTKLLQQVRKHGWRRVAITSAGPGSGKTMTCLNLAFSLARQSDLKTMVVELDLRRPSMSHVLGLRDQIQFSNALSNKEAPEEHLRRYGSNLIFAVNQSAARHSAELLQGNTAAAVLDQIEEAYAPDIMIFDTPPMMAGDDTLAFLDQIDCALLVVEAERTQPDIVDKSEQELAARTNVLGVILNKCRYLDSSETYGYGDY